MILTADELVRATGGTLHRSSAAGPILTDSRRLAPGSWFLALRGDRFDGHDFLGHAAAAGCAGAIVDTPPEGWERGLLVVPDTLKALQDCAAWVRNDFHGTTVGITGSAGKTTTRAMVEEILASVGRVHGTQGNLNNHIGLPLTLLDAPPDADVLVLEMGMSAPGEIRDLQAIARPTHRVITNVSAAHIQGTGSVDGVARCKQELFDGAQPGDVVLVNDDDPRVRAMPIPEGVRVVRYGSSPQCEVRLGLFHVDATTLSTVVNIELPSGSVSARINSPGEHLAWCAVAAAAVGHSLHVGADAIGQALTRYAPVGMRMRVEELAGVRVLNDAYNANPASMFAALRTLAQLPGRRIAALGDMLELGSIEEEAHASVGKLLQGLDLDLVALAGPRMGRIADDLRSAGVTVIQADNSDDLGQQLQGQIQAGDVLLLKGSRGARMERILQAMRTQEANA